MNKKKKWIPITLFIITLLIIPSCAWIGSVFSPIQLGNIVATNVTASIFTIIHFICLCGIYKGSNSQEEFRYWAVNLLFTLLGAATGWVIGNLASPINKNEQIVFNELGTTIATFLSGYAVSKLDRLVEQGIFKGGTINKKRLISGGFFISALIIMSVWVFLNRFYALSGGAIPPGGAIP